MICDVNVVQVRKNVMEEVNKAGKAKKLRGFEMIKSVLLDEEAWSGMQAPSSYDNENHHSNDVNNHKNSNNSN